MADLSSKRGIKAINKREKQKSKEYVRPVPKEKASTKRDRRRFDGRWRILAYQIVTVITVPFLPVSLRRWISEVLMIRATAV